jgi:hypothetical protein
LTGVAVNVRLVPEQIAPAGLAAIETLAGNCGLTVTVIVNGAPEQDPIVDDGVTIYCTVPARELLGLVNVWAIVVPVPATAPVILPVMVPMLQLNPPGVLDVNGMLVVSPLQITAAGGLRTTGVGFTVTVIE